MKPLRLTATAFGPFGGTIEIDFEHLAGLGLFVVSGDTGAGKTSIFDAMFYAFYGALPGDRCGNQHVRSDHAAPDQECEVTLEFLAGAETWRVSRKPTQSRAKRRGGGFTQVKAAASLEKMVGDAWEAVAAGVLHVDSEVRPLVGLTPEQFERVVLLPQGHFRRVLDASSVEREKLLRTLFGSQLFQDMSNELRARSQKLTGECREQRQERDIALRHVAKMIDTLEPHEAPPSNVRYLDPSPAGDDQGNSAPSIGELQAALSDAEASLVAPLRTESTASDLALGQVRTALDQARKDHALLLERDRLLATQARLDSERPDWEGVRSALARAREVEAANRAVEDYRTLAAGHQASGDELAIAIRSANAALVNADVPHTLSLTETLDDQIDAALADIEERSRTLDAVRRTAKELDSLDRVVQAGEADVSQLGAQAVTTADQTAGIEHTLRDLASQRHALGLLTVDAPARNRAALDLSEQLARQESFTRSDAERRAIAGEVESEVAHLSSCEAEIDMLEATLAEAGDVESQIAQASAGLAELVLVERRMAAIHDLAERERHLDQESQSTADRAAAVYAAFLADAAPRLAERLVDGEPCPVCGSSEHPAAAGPSASSPSASERSTAAIDADAVSAAAAAAEEAVARLASTRAELAVLVEAHGDTELSTEAITAERCRFESDLASARAREAELGDAAQRLSAATRSRQELTERLVMSKDRETQATAVVERIRGALGDDPIDSEGLRARLQSAVRDRDEAQSAVEQLSATEARERSLTTQLDELRATSADLERARTARTVEVENQRNSAAAMRAEVAAALGDGDADLALERVGSARKALMSTRDLARQHWQLTRELASAHSAVDLALADAGCASPEAALDAAMAPNDLARLGVDLKSWDERDQQCRAALSIASSTELPIEAPDLDRLAHELDVAVEHHRSVLQRLGIVQDRVAHCVGELERIASSDRDGADQVAAADVAARVAGIVAGENDQRVSLEGWVLAAHLRRVVDHANVHLQSMCAGRYTLAVADQPADQRARHGLDLVVEDAFTGATRPTRSLSGGESFQASLALALGLGDVVCSQRASLHIDAIFIDEGFGTLDAGSIDQAIDVLDGLRSTGATIGVITHVDAVKAALPTGLQVERCGDASGSTVRQAA